MTTTNDKLRAVFLAALMVLSVSAGAASFAGATTLDGGGNVPAGDIGAAQSVVVNDHLVNATAGPSAITVGYNVSDTANNDTELNWTVSNATGVVESGAFNEAQNDTTVNDSVTLNNLVNGGNYTFTIHVYNTTSGTNVTTDTATIHTFGVLSDDTPTTTTSSGGNFFEAANVSLSTSQISSIDVNLSAGNLADNVTVDQIAQIEAQYYNDTGVLLDDATATYDAEPKTFADPPENTSRVVIIAQTSTSLKNGTVIDAQLTFNYNPSTTLDTAGSATAFTGVDSGSITGDVRDTNNNIFENATVEITNVDTGTVVATTQTDSSGVYTTNVGGGANYTATVTNLSAPNNIDNYDVRPTPNVQIDHGASGRVDIRLERIQRPTNLVLVDVNPTSVPSDNSTEITVTLELRDQDGNVLGGETINAGSPSATVYFPNGTSDTTGTNGQVTFTVKSNETQTATLQFAHSSVSLGASSSDLQVETSVDFTPTFLNKGDGVITGTVGHTSQANVEDASVYAVREDRYQRNLYSIQLNFSNHSASTVSFRIQNTSDDTLIDSDLYHVYFNGSTATADRANFTVNSDIRPLNASDSAAGNGFNISQRGSDDTITVLVLMQEAGNYTIQDANGTVPAATDFSDRAIFEVNANLTMADAQNRMANSGQNLVDTTDEDGDFRLTNLNTNESAGRNYIVVAHKAGLSRAFSLVYSVDDTGITDQIDLVLEDRDAPPVDSVNITDVGIAQTDGGAFSVPEGWASTNDSYAQEVPRDGSYDVIKVETFVKSTGANGNGTVVLEVPDNSSVDALSESTQTSPAEQHRSFAGEFTSVDDGTIVSTGEDTVTLYTGDDGVAWVYLQTDEASTDLTDSDVTSGDYLDADGDFTGVMASLQGASATDRTNKTFIGVTAMKTASLSGLVTDGNNEPIPDSFVFLSQLTHPSGATFDIEAVSTSYQEFNVTRQSTGQTVTLTRTEMKSYDFAEFPEVTAEAPVKLLADQLTSQARYTMEPAPAADAGLDVEITGVSPTGEIGQSGATITSNLTSTSNVVIAGATGAQVSVTGFTVSSSNVSTGETVTITATVENTGDRSGSIDVTFRADGSAVETTTVDVAAASNTTVTHDVTFSTAGNHTVSVADLDATDITVTDGGGSPLSGAAGEADTDNDGAISDSELSTAITEWAAGSYTDSDLSSIISAWAAS